MLKSPFRPAVRPDPALLDNHGALIRREAPALHSSTPTQIAEAIRVGPGQMPAFGDAALTDEQMASVVAPARINLARNTAYVASPAGGSVTSDCNMLLTTFSPAMCSTAPEECSWAPQVAVAAR